MQERLHSLQDNEFRLVMDQSSIPAAGELHHSIDATDEDADRRQHECEEEQPERFIVQQRLMFRDGPRSLTGLPVPPSELGGQDDEQGQGDDLKDQTGNGDVTAQLRVLVGLGSYGGDATTGTL